MSEFEFKTPDNGQATLKISRGGRRPGAGRKPKGNEVRKVSLALSPEDWETIDKIKKLEGETQSDLLARMVKKGLEMELIFLMDKDGKIDWGK